MSGIWPHFRSPPRNYWNPQGHRSWIPLPAQPSVAPQSRAAAVTPRPGVVRSDYSPSFLVVRGAFPMRIVQLVPTLSVGGAERIVALLAREQVELGHAVDVVVLGHSEDSWLEHSFGACSFQCTFSTRVRASPSPCHIVSVCSSGHSGHRWSTPTCTS